MSILEHQLDCESTVVCSLGAQLRRNLVEQLRDYAGRSSLAVGQNLRRRTVENSDNTRGTHPSWRNLGRYAGTPYPGARRQNFLFQHTPSLNPDKRYVNCYSSRDQVAFLHLPLEGGALVHYRGLYYVIGSHLTGWRPNPNVYASAPSLSHSWSEFAPIVTASPDTYGSQSSMLLAVSGSKTTSVIFTGDMWEPKSLWDSCYLWMPVTIGDGKMLLPAPSPWTIDIKTGLTVRGF